MRVAIIGAGPAGSALAILLAREGADVTLFDDGRRPELLVGESLVPAVVPILRSLGIEEETATFSRVKPGVSFIWSPTDRVSVTFNRFAPAVFPYAYNVPRPRFDDALLAKAIASGVATSRPSASCARNPSTIGSGAALAPETLAAAALRSPARPDRGRHRTGAPRGPHARDPRAARAPQGRRPLRPLRGLPLGRRAGPGAHRAWRGGLELVHSAAGAALDRRSCWTRTTQLASAARPEERLDRAVAPTPGCPHRGRRARVTESRPTPTTS